MVNFDRAVCNSKVAVAFIIRNEGALLCADGKSLSICSVPYAELIGA